MTLGERLEHLKLLIEKATPKPWEYVPCESTGVVHSGFTWVAIGGSKNDALLIASMRQVLPQLIDLVNKQNAALSNARFELRLRVYSKIMDAEITNAMEKLNEEQP